MLPRQSESEHLSRQERMALAWLRVTTGGWPQGVDMETDPNRDVLPALEDFGYIERLPDTGYWRITERGRTVR